MNAIWMQILLLFLLSACAGRRVTVRNVGGLSVELQMSSKTSDILYGKWLNSYEEQKDDGILIYRPTNFPFPESRNRTGVEFLKEGKFNEYSFLPDDRPFAYEGEWIYGVETQTLEIAFHKLEANPLPVTVKSRKGYVFLIDKLENGLLRLKKLPILEKESENANKN